jgi:hypothetical protein
MDNVHSLYTIELSEKYCADSMFKVLTDCLYLLSDGENVEYFSSQFMQKYRYYLDSMKTLFGKTVPARLLSQEWQNRFKTDVEKMLSECETSERMNLRLQNIAKRIENEYARQFIKTIFDIAIFLLPHHSETKQFLVNVMCSQMLILNGQTFLKPSA